MFFKSLFPIGLLAGALWALGCSRQQAPEAGNDAAFRTVPPTEAANFLHTDTLHAPTRSGQSKPDSSQWFRLLQAPPASPDGWYRATGLLVAAGQGFYFVGGQGDTCSFVLQVPAARQALDTSSGLLALRAGSTAAGADERLEWWHGPALRFGYCWQSGPRALSMPAGPAPVLRQLPLRVLPRGNALTDVPVELRTDAGPLRLPPGEQRLFRWKGQAYAALLRSSVYLSQAEDGQRGYVLQALLWQTGD